MEPQQEKQRFSLTGWQEGSEHYRSNPKSNTGKLTSRSHAWRPPTDVFELPDEIVVRVEIAGMQEDDFKISIDDQRLVVRGMRVDVPEKRAYHQMEIRYGEFNTEVDLRVAVQVDQARAQYQRGFLTITLPKIQPKQIQITDL